MKKLIVIALAVVMAFAVVAFAACGVSGEADGEYSYNHPYAPDSGAKYGAKVHLTVKNGVITALTVEADTDTFFNLTSTWTEAGKKTWNDNKDAFVQSFIGLKISDVKAIKVACAENGVPNENGITEFPATLKVVTGCTQSSGRIILAVQDAISKLEAAK